MPSPVSSESDSGSPARFCGSGRRRVVWRMAGVSVRVRRGPDPTRWNPTILHPASCSWSSGSKSWTDVAVDSLAVAPPPAALRARIARDLQPTEPGVESVNHMSSAGEKKEDLVPCAPCSCPCRADGLRFGMLGPWLSL